MSSPTRRAASPPVRIAGLKLITVFSALCLLFVLLAIVAMVSHFSPSPWLTRLAVVLVAAAYAGYVVWLSSPRLPLVTEEDTDPMSVRLYRSVARICAQAGLPMPRIVIDPAETVNAETFGLRPKTAYIRVYEGLLKVLDKDDELDAVIAHEVSHIANRDCAAGTAFNLVMLMAQMLYSVSSSVLSIGAATTGCVGQIAAAFASGGLIGLVIGLGILCLFAAFMMYTAFFTGVALALLALAILAINGFSRQRERLADDFAAQIVGPPAVARVMVKLAVSNPQDRLMVCQLIGMEPSSKASVPVNRVLEAVHGARLSYTLASRITELLAPHPLTLRRIQRLLIGAQTMGPLEALIAPLAKIIESFSPWLTPERRAAAKAPSDREGRTLLAGAAIGLIWAFVAASLPHLNALTAYAAIGLPSGLIVGIAVALILSRRGPFLGPDVIDAILTGVLGWFLGAVAVSGALLLPNGVALLAAAWVVLLGASAMAIVGYAFLPPAAAAEATAAEAAPVQAVPAPPPRAARPATPPQAASAPAAALGRAPSPRPRAKPAAPPGKEVVFEEDVKPGAPKRSDEDDLMVFGEAEDEQ